MSGVEELLGFFLDCRVVRDSSSCITCTVDNVSLRDDFTPQDDEDAMGVQLLNIFCTRTVNLIRKFLTDKSEERKKKTIYIFSILFRIRKGERRYSI